MDSLSDYSFPVYKAFQQEDLILGVQKGIFLMIFLIMALVWYLVGIIASVVVTAIIYIPARILTKVDVHMISIALSSLLEKDEMEG